MKPPPVQITSSDIFIIESLGLDDETKEQYDGRILYQTLKLHGKNPIYYYVRTALELSEVAKIFRETGYRYLHLSCHGSPGIVKLTFENVTFAKFAQYFTGLLNNRRVFASGCSLGNQALASSLFAVNGGMYSLTGPQKKVFFDQSSAFWSAFYYLMHAEDSQSMKKQILEATLKQICPLFGVPVAHYFKNTAKGAAVDEQTF